jgi:hypothetical protein
MLCPFQSMLSVVGPPILIVMYTENKRGKIERGRRTCCLRLYCSYGLGPYVCPRERKKNVLKAVIYIITRFFVFPSTPVVSSIIVL